MPGTLRPIFAEIDNCMKFQLHSNVTHIRTNLINIHILYYKL